ncbi:HAMP domain-containing protein [Streptomyces hirsutus]
MTSSHVAPPTAQKRAPQPQTGGHAAARRHPPADRGAVRTDPRPGRADRPGARPRQRPRRTEGRALSQQHYAEDGAIALRASIDERVTVLRRTVTALNAGKPAEPEDVLSDLGRTYQKWTGTTVVDLESGDVLAARGERIPLAWLDKDVLTGKSALLPRMARLETGDVRLMTMALLDWKGPSAAVLLDRLQQSVRAAHHARPVPHHGGRGTRRRGARHRRLRAVRGAQLGPAAPGTRIPPEADVRPVRPGGRTDRGTPRHRQGARFRGYPGVSGTLLGDDYNSRVVAVGYASLSSSDPEEKESVAAGLGLTVVAMLPAVAEQSGATGRELYGLIAAGALVVLGLLAAGFLWARVQRPLLRLFLESRRLARGDLTRPVGAFRGGEAAASATPWNG